ncbi:MAG: nucleotidyltransferase family protein, partial [Deltaproteobacteria bacterium]|nr:nucleotidyltransferase family protein [Deltaproteobacteria bacterium]
ISSRFRSWCPTLAVQAYGDLSLRTCKDLNIFIREPDIAPTLTTLRRLGYQRDTQLTAAQLNLMQHFAGGQETLSNKNLQTAVTPRTRLLPRNIALDIDYTGIWRRAQRVNLIGRTMLTLAAEDNLLILAINGTYGMWWNISWACDIAAFIGSHPKFDWDAVMERAKAQGSLRMVLLSIAMARKHFRAIVPNAVIAAERADRTLEPMLGCTMAGWLAFRAVGQPANKGLLLNRLRLHDGTIRRARFMAKTMFLPSCNDIASLSLPRSFSFAYYPIKLADRLIAPLERTYRQLARIDPLRRVLRTQPIRLLLICGPWGSGTRAVAGVVERLGAQGFGPYLLTHDERTPVTYEFIHFRATVLRYASEDTLALRPGGAEGAQDGMRGLHRTIELQEFGPYDPRGPAPVFFKYPLSALLLPQICAVFDTLLIYVMRPPEDIERTRLRRKWRPSEDRAGAEIIYQAMDNFKRRQSHWILTVNYADLLAAPADHASEISCFAGLRPDPLSFEEAIAFVRPKEN